jgi:hypothetical protein
MRPLIAIHGAAGAGKGEIATRLVVKHGFVERAFADPLYQAVSAITGMPVAWLKDRANKETVIPWLGKSPRQLLQLLGEEFGRQMLGRDVWIKRLIREVEGLQSPVVVSDLRYDNEAEAIIAAGGVVWKVVRPGSGCLADDTAKHSSERGISRHLISSRIYNTGTLDDLRFATDVAVDRLLADIM